MATLYADSVNGLDSNSGTQALPKRTWGAMVAAATSGDTLLFKRDCCFGPTNGFFATINLKNNITIGNYGTGDLPVLDSLTYELADATGWNHEGNGIWSKLFGTGANSNSRVLRLWTGATNTGNLRTQRSTGTAMRRAKSATADNLTSITANLSATDIWWPSNSGLGYKLYVYTGSTTIAPPAFYNGLTLLVRDASTVGAFNSILLRQVNGVVIDGIESWGSGATAFLAQSEVADTVPTTNIVIRNCVAKYWYAGAFKAAPWAQNSALPRVECSNVLLQNCFSDSMTSASEQEPDVATYNYLINVQDAFSFLDSAKNCRAEYCTSVNSMHVGFTMGAYSNTTLLTDQSGYYKCKAYFDPWHAYCRGVTVYNCTDSCYVQECTIDGQNVCSQINGSPYVYSNVWKNLRLCPSKTGVSHCIAITAELLNRSGSYPAQGNDSYVRNEPHNVRLVKNVFIDPVGPVITMVTFNAYGFPVPEPVIADDTVHCLDNIAIHTAQPSTSWLQTTNRSSAVGKQNYRNNAVFTGSGNPAATVSLNGTIYAVNAAPGHSENITADPLLDTSNPNALSLSPASPCRYRGGYRAIEYSDDRRSQVAPNIGPIKFSAISIP